MMGWMHDTLGYFKNDPVYRRYHHNEITFSLVYAFSESFMLPLSHDEVVHGKGSLIDRMPGDEWQKFANLRMLFGYMFTHPGTQLLFMGGEFGQTSEWSLEKGLAWDLLQFDYHKGVQTWVKALNEYYKSTPELFELQFSPDGFSWINHGDHENSVLSYLRKGEKENEVVIVVCNFTPVVREGHKIGVPFDGKWKEVLNSDDKTYGGTGHHKNTKLKAEAAEVDYDGQPYSLELLLPPLSVLVLEGTAAKSKKKKTK